MGSNSKLPSKRRERAVEGGKSRFGAGQKSQTSVNIKIVPIKISNVKTVLVSLHQP
jgi:hypothetical protein